MILASPTPVAPYFKPKRKMGSRIIDKIVPIIVLSMASKAKPSVRIKFCGTKEKIIKTEPRAIIR